MGTYGLEERRKDRVVEVADRRGNAFELDRGRFHANVAATRKMLLPGTKIYQCVKGNGYGIGIERAIELGISGGVDGFCLGTPEEAMRAKRVAGDLPVLLFAGCLPSALGEMVEAGVIVSVSSIEGFAELVRSGAVGEFFLKLECGFRRYGLDESALLTVLSMYRRQSSVRCIGAYSHFGSRSAQLVATALPLFDRLAGLVQEAAQAPIETMVASSPLIQLRPDLSYSAVDPGRLLYGMMSADGCAASFSPIVPRISSTLLQITPFDEAQDLAVGYAATIAIPAGGKTGVFPLGWIDGLPAHTGLGEVLVHGVRVPVITRTLQHSIVNLSAVPAPRLGDEVVVVGEQGNERITLEDMAAALGMNINEAHLKILGAIAADSTSSRPCENSAALACGHLDKPTHNSGGNTI